MKKIFAGFDVLHVFLFVFMCLGFGLAAGMFYADVNTEQFLDTESGSTVRIGGKLYAAVSEVGEDFLVGETQGEGFVVSNGKTWISIDTPPIELTIINDPKCGLACDTTQAVQVFKTMISPALIVDEVSADSEIGKQLVDAFEVQGFPAYFVGKSIEQIPSSKGGPLPMDFPQIFQAHNDFDLYRVDASLDASLRARTFGEDLAFTIPDAAKQGNDDAPVEIVEFTAYYCGYCEKFFRETGDTVKEMVENGEISYAIKHFPIGEDYTPHYAAICATEQDKFWEMHNLLFSKKQAWIRASNKAETMKEFAYEIDLDVEAFEACMVSDEVKTDLAASVAEGQKYGVTGTPSFFLNNISRSGFMEPNLFRAVVDSMKE